MWFQRALVCGLIVVAGCKGELSMSSFGLGSKKPKPEVTPGSTAAPQGGVTPTPTVGNYEAGKSPPWCAGHTPSTGDSNASWFKSYYEREGWAGKTIEYAAKAACDKPNDGERQKQVAQWSAMYKADFFGATDRDFVEAMTFGMLPQEEGNRLQEEQCAPYKTRDAEASAEQVALRSAVAWVLGCGNDPDDDILYWLDRPQIMEVHRVALVNTCVRHDPAKETTKGEFAFCMVDLKKLDRAALDKELASMKVNLYGKLNVVQSFQIAKKRAQLLLQKYAELAKDEDWQRLLAAPEAGWASYMKVHQANLPVFEAIRDFDRNAAKGSKKALAGCAATLRPLLFAHMSKQKVKSLEEAQNAASDNVGYPLMVAMMRCDAAEGNLLAVSAAQDLFMNRAKSRRGPRFESYDATLKVLNDIRADREKFPLERTYPNLPDTGRQLWYAAYEQTFNKISHDRGTGQIQDAKQKGDVVHLTFKTVKWKDQEAYGCRNTRRIYRIRDDGTLEYEQVCKYKTVTRSSTLAPVDVPADFAKGLKPGMMVELTLDTGRDGKVMRTGLPKSVWRDVDKKKFAGTYGVVW